MTTITCTYSAKYFVFSTIISTSFHESCKLGKHFVFGEYSIGGAEEHAAPDRRGPEPALLVVEVEFRGVEELPQKSF